MSERRSQQIQNQAKEESSVANDQMMMNSASGFQTPGSYISQRPSLSLSDTERFSHEDILRILVNDVDTFARKFGTLVVEADTTEADITEASLPDDSTQDYSDILRSKGIFVNKLAQAIGSFHDNPNGILKYSNLGLVELMTLFKQRFAEIKKNVASDKDLLKEQQNESNELSSQLNIFQSLVQDVDDGHNEGKFAEAKKIFEEAKTDVDLVLTHCFPLEADKKKLSRAMSALVNQYVENPDSKEDQYVQIVPDILKNNSVLRLLMLGHIITEHPDDPKKFRMSIS